MVTITDRRAESGNPTAGTRVTLLSQQDGRPYPGTVRSWLLPPEGRGASARISVAAGAARRLTEKRVWLAVAAARYGFTVYAALARRLDDSALDVIGLVPMLREDRRRAAPRAPADGLVTVTSGAGQARRMAAVDLSRGGVRVQAAGGGGAAARRVVRLDVRLEGGATVVLRGEVCRVDEALRQAVARFDHPPTEARTQIDRYVLVRATRPLVRRPGPEPAGLARPGQSDAGDASRSPADHFSSIRPNRQTARATTQVSTNSADDGVADVVEVEAADRGQRSGGDAELVGEDRQQLDRADDQRDGDRQPGDGDVVVDLAHRLGERPAVGEVHEAAVDASRAGSCRPRTGPAA